MDCTQRLVFGDSQTETICPEQIGFLGVLGTKYPVKRGPNKIGRDPQTCNIVLNLNSISRLHAVLNVINGKDFVLMDLDSANKTRINNKSLQAYIPVTISNGDTVQFGEVFGVFRLLEEETDLPCTQAVDVPCTQAVDVPCTQAVDVPDTPVTARPARLCHATVPESPDVSDKDDSFIMPSQPKPQNKLRCPRNNFIKSSSIGTNNASASNMSCGKFSFGSCVENFPQSKIDESIHESNTQLPFDQPNTANEDDIFEAETQLPSKNMFHKDSESIHDMETQAPFLTHNASTDSIYIAETQLPPVNASPSIYSQETQLPKIDDFEVRDSPKSIYEVNTQLPFEEPNVSSKQNDDVFNAETQLSNKDDHNLSKVDKSNHDANKEVHDEKQADSNEMDVNVATQQLTAQRFNVSIDLKDNSKKITEDVDKSDEVILFKEVDAYDDFNDLNASQPILGGDILQIQDESEDIPLSQSDTITDDDFEIRLENTKTTVKPAKRDNRPNSNVSTDCEELDFLPTQKIPEIPMNEDRDTDCEEDELDDKKDDKSVLPKNDFNDLATQVIPEAGPSCHFEELATQVISKIDNVQKSNNMTNEENFEDMLTQVIPEDNSDKVTDFEDLPTQLITEDVASKSSLQFSEEIVSSPFKIPLQTPIKMKKKDVPNKGNDIKSTKSPLEKSNTNSDGDQKYYAATQELFNDLCSQQFSAIDSKTINNNLLKSKAGNLDKSRNILSPVEDVKVGTKVPNFEGEMEISVKKFARESSSESSDGEDKVNRFVKNLSAKQISNVIGADVAVLKRVPSDPSDVDVTPKKVRPGRFMETLLPDSQEIKTSVSLSTKTEETDSSSESEKESQEQTPIVFRKKKRVKADVKKDLSSKFDIQALPTRIITRMRKPTVKVQENDAENKKRSRNILKPKFLNDSEQDEVDTEIISENITRLRSKHDKKVHTDTSVDSKKSEEVNTECNQRKSNEKNVGVSKLKTEQDNKNKSKNNSKETVVDLTTVDEGKPKSRRKNDRSKNNKDKLNDKTKPTDASKSGSDKQNSNREILKASKHKSDDNVKRKSNDETKNTVVDLTELSEEKPRSRRNAISKNKDNAVNSTIPEENKLNEIDTSKEKAHESGRIGRPRKKDVQDKITNYTVTKDESRISHTSTKVDESLNMTDDKNSTMSSRRSNKDISNREKSVLQEPETIKRKRGRPRKEDKDTQHDSKEAKKRKTDEKQEAEQPEVRRSRRQKTTKDNSQSAIRKHEQSTVYNLSSESSADSPKRKRKEVAADLEAPTAKRTRSNNGTVLISSDTSSACTTVNSNASSLRSTPSRVPSTHYVLFTAFPNEDVKEMLEKLGAVIVSDVSACTMVLTLQLKRTFKLLCAVGLGRPIVGPEWVKACHAAGSLVDPWQHILRDAAGEARFGCSLARALRGPRGYLRGRHVTATPRVLPGASEMKLIVECSGGSWGRGAPGRWLAVTAPADRALHAALRAQGATLVSSELVLAGVLRQELDVDRYLLE